MLRRSLIFFLFFLTNFSLFASDEKSDPYRFKVDVSQMCFQRDGMYVIYNGYLTPISSLEFENGEYFAEIPFGIIEDILGLWWCYNCQNYNSKFDPRCTYCGKPRA